MGTKETHGVISTRRHPGQEPSQNALHLCGQGIDMLIARDGEPLLTGVVDIPGPFIYFDANLRYAVTVVKEMTPVPSPHFATKIVRVRQPYLEERSVELKTRRQSFYIYENPEKMALGNQPEQRVDTADAIENIPYPSNLTELEEFARLVKELEKDLYTDNLAASHEAAASHEKRVRECQEEMQDVVRRWGIPIGQRRAVLGDPALDVVIAALEPTLKFGIRRD